MILTNGSDASALRSWAKKAPPVITGRACFSSNKFLTPVNDSTHSPARSQVSKVFWHRGLLLQQNANGDIWLLNPDGERIRRLELKTVIGQTELARRIELKQVHDKFSRPVGPKAKA